MEKTEKEVVAVLTGRPNKPDAVNPAIASQLHFGYHWRGVTDPERSAYTVFKHNELHNG